MARNERVRSTTVLAVRRDRSVVLGGDGQVTVGQTVAKATARKVRRMHDGQVLAGFAGSAADGIALFEKFEAKLKEHNGNLARAAVELAKDWRTDRVLRRLEAMMIVADRERTFLLSGTGDVIEPDEGVIAIGQDLTALRAMERRAEHFQRLAAFGRLAAGIVHELNNPLVAVVTYSDHLLERRRGTLLDPGDAEKLRRIRDAGERIQKLARDLITYARPSDDRPESLDHSIRRRFSASGIRSEIDKLVFSEEQAAAFDSIRGEYQQMFSEPTTKYGLRPKAIEQPDHIRQLTAFFAWAAWASA